MCHRESARRLIEAARRQRVARTLIDDSAMPAAMFAAPDAPAEFTNVAWRKLFGDRPVDEILKRHVEAVLRLGAVLHIPELAIAGTGLVYCAATLRPARGSLGATSGAIVVCDLITDQVVAHRLGVEPGTRIMSGLVNADADYFNAVWRAHSADRLPLWKLAIHPDDLGRCLDALSEATRTRTTTEVEARLYDREEPRWHRVVFSIADGRWFGSAADIHAARTTSVERAELLATALAARADAEQANRRKDQFLAAVSHELRAPVTTMMLWDKVLRDGGSDAALREQALDAIHDSAVAQSRLVGDLLDISRAISGKLHVDLRSIDVSQILAEACSSIAAAAAARGISIVKPTSSKPVLVEGDPFRVRQIFDNLLSNAIKFTPRGGAVGVSISTRQRTVTISIVDTGRGIPSAFLERIFEPFSQSEDTLTRSGSGLGLGLAIAKQLVELQHGTLTVTSAGQDLGSTFSVSLPEAGRASSPTVAPHASTLGRIRILVVDDDRRVLDALALLLERAGAIVVTAQSADLARLRTAEQLPDLLLCDIAMPGEDGYGLISSLRASGVSVPAIALTAHAMESDAARALAAGFDVHLAKPIDFERLIGSISTLIASRADAAHAYDS